MAGLLFIGLMCNALVKPVADHHYMSDEELEHERALQHERSADSAHAATAARGQAGLGTLLAWVGVGVGVPFLIGVWVALSKGAALF